MTQKQLTLAQIGCGYWGPNLLRNFSAQSDCRVKYVVDPSPERRSYVETNFPRTQAITNLDTVLNDAEIDAVVIATPAASHYQLAKQALESGKHIFVEKPICTSLDSRKEMIRACQASNIILAVGYHLRWHQGLRKIAKEAANKTLGEIHHLRLHWAINFLERAKWRINSEGRWCCLSVLGTHLIDIMRWMMVPTCGEVIDIKSIVKKII